MIVQRRGRILVYGKAGDERTKRTRRSRVLFDVGEAEVAIKNRPLGEKDRCSTPRSFPLLLLVLLCEREPEILRVLVPVASLKYEMALDVEACVRSSNAAMPVKSAGLSGAGSVKVC